MGRRMPAGQRWKDGGDEYAIGHEFDYVERTTSLTVTATTEAAANSWIDGSAVTYDGLTRIQIECQGYLGIAAAAVTAVPVLLDGSTVLGWLAEFASPGNTGGFDYSFRLSRFLTPAKGSHTYHVKWWKTNASGGVTIAAGAGSGSGSDMPAWLRVTRA